MASSIQSASTHKSTIEPRGAPEFDRESAIQRSRAKRGIAEAPPAASPRMKDNVALAAASPAHGSDAGPLAGLRDLVTSRLHPAAAAAATAATADLADSNNSGDADSLDQSGPRQLKNTRRFVTARLNNQEAENVSVFSARFIVDMIVLSVSVFALLLVALSTVSFVWTDEQAYSPDYFTLRGWGNSPRGRSNTGNYSDSRSGSSSIQPVGADRLIPNVCKQIGLRARFGVRSLLRGNQLQLVGLLMDDVLHGLQSGGNALGAYASEALQYLTRQVTRGSGKQSKWKSLASFNVGFPRKLASRFASAARGFLYPVTRGTVWLVTEPILTVRDSVSAVFRSIVGTFTSYMSSGSRSARESLAGQQAPPSDAAAEQPPTPPPAPLSPVVVSVPVSHVLSGDAWAALLSQRRDEVYAVMEVELKDALGTAELSDLRLEPGSLRIHFGVPVTMTPAAGVAEADTRKAVEGKTKELAKAYTKTLQKWPFERARLLYEEFERAQREEGERRAADVAAQQHTADRLAECERKTQQLGEKVAREASEAKREAEKAKAESARLLEAQMKQCEASAAALEKRCAAERTEHCREELRSFENDCAARHAELQALLDKANADLKAAGQECARLVREKADECTAKVSGTSESCAARVEGAVSSATQRCRAECDELVSLTQQQGNATLARTSEAAARQCAQEREAAEKLCHGECDQRLQELEASCTAERESAGASLSASQARLSDCTGQLAAVMEGQDAATKALKKKVEELSASAQAESEKLAAEREKQREAAVAKEEEIRALQREAKKAQETAVAACEGALRESEQKSLAEHQRFEALVVRAREEAARATRDEMAQECEATQKTLSSTYDKKLEEQSQACDKELQQSARAQEEKLLELHSAQLKQAEEVGLARERALREQLDVLLGVVLHGGDGRSEGEAPAACQPQLKKLSSLLRQDSGASDIVAHLNAMGGCALRWQAPKSASTARATGCRGRATSLKTWLVVIGISFCAGVFACHRASAEPKPLPGQQPDSTPAHPLEDRSTHMRDVSSGFVDAYYEALISWHLTLCALYTNEAALASGFRVSALDTLSVRDAAVSSFTLVRFTPTPQQQQQQEHHLEEEGGTRGSSRPQRQPSDAEEENTAPFCDGVAHSSSSSSSSSLLLRPRTTGERGAASTGSDAEECFWAYCCRCAEVYFESLESYYVDLLSAVMSRELSEAQLKTLIGVTDEQARTVRRQTDTLAELEAKAAAQEELISTLQDETHAHDGDDREQLAAALKRAVDDKAALQRAANDYKLEAERAKNMADLQTEMVALLEEQLRRMSKALNSAEYKVVEASSNTTARTPPPSRPPPLPESAQPTENRPANLPTHSGRMTRNPAQTRQYRSLDWQDYTDFD